MAFAFDEYPSLKKKAGYEWALLPDGSDYAIKSTKSAPGTPIGDKFIYSKFESGSGKMKLNIMFDAQPKPDQTADIIFR